MARKFDKSPLISKNAVIAVLGGEREALISAVHWRCTPQGDRHWFEICSGTKRLSKRSRQYLNKLISD